MGRHALCVDPFRELQWQIENQVEAIAELVEPCGEGYRAVWQTIIARRQEYVDSLLRDHPELKEVYTGQ